MFTRADVYAIDRFLPAKLNLKEDLKIKQISKKKYIKQREIDS